MTWKNPALSPMAVLSGGALLSAFLLSGCKTETRFVDFKDEICTDNVDNDEDNLVDCDDSDCDLNCAVELILFPPGNTATDSLRVQGTYENAASITIQVTPDGAGGNAVLNAGAGTWEFLIQSISSTAVHTVTATATSAKGKKDTAIATFEKRL